MSAGMIQLSYRLHRTWLILRNFSQAQLFPMIYLGWFKFANKAGPPGDKKQQEARKSEAPGRTILCLPSPCKQWTVIRGLRGRNLRQPWAIIKQQPRLKRFDFVGKMDISGNNRFIDEILKKIAKIFMESGEIAIIWWATSKVFLLVVDKLVHKRLITRHFHLFYVDGAVDERKSARKNLQRG